MSITQKKSTVKNSAFCTNLALTSGQKVKRRKFAPPPPPAPVLTIGKLISLDLILGEYEITPNAQTAARLDGAK